MSVPRTGPLKWLHVNYHNGFALKAAVFLIYSMKKLFWLVSLPFSSSSSSPFPALPHVADQKQEFYDTEAQFDPRRAFIDS